MAKKKVKREPTILYFAYGSNLNKKQMRQRCPDAKVVGPATLKGYRLLFNANGTGIGYADVIEAKRSEVPGGLWIISDRDLVALDQYEGYPRLYDRKTVTVFTSDGDPVEALVYQMTPGHRPSMPAEYYVRICVQGYSDFGLDVGAFAKAYHYTRRAVNKARKEGEEQPAARPKCKACGRPIPEKERAVFDCTGKCLACHWKKEYGGVQIEHGR